MEFKGTKYPWFVGEADLIEGGKSLVVAPVEKVFYKNKGWRVICSISQIKDIEAEDEANAILISKAPEMLEMLKKAYSFIDDSGVQSGSNDILNKIDQLIKQATEL